MSPAPCHAISDSLTTLHISGGSKGGRKGRAPPPPGSKFFQFHAVFGKNWQNRMLATPPRGNPGSDPLPQNGVIRSKTEVAQNHLVMWFRWFWAIVRFWPSDPIWRPWVKHWSCSKLFGNHIVLFLTFTLLPPASEGYVFTRVCLSTGESTWAGYTPPGQVHSRAGTPPGRYTPRAGTPPWAGTLPPQCMLGYGQ